MIRFLSLLNLFLVGLRDELQDTADELAEQLDDDNQAIALLTDVADELLALEAFSPALEAASDVLLRLVGLRLARVVNAVWADAKDAEARTARRRGLSPAALNQVAPQRMAVRRLRFQELRETRIELELDEVGLAEAYAAGPLAPGRAPLPLGRRPERLVLPGRRFASHPAAPRGPAEPPTSPPST